jgi:hypothetical protein
MQSAAWLSPDIGSLMGTGWAGKINKKVYN